MLNGHALIVVGFGVESSALGSHFELKSVLGNVGTVEKHRYLIVSARLCADSMGFKICVPGKQ